MAIFFINYKKYAECEESICPHCLMEMYILAFLIFLIVVCSNTFSPIYPFIDCKFEKNGCMQNGNNTISYSDICFQPDGLLGKCVVDESLICYVDGMGKCNTTYMFEDKSSFNKTKKCEFIKDADSILKCSYVEPENSEYNSYLINYPGFFFFFFFFIIYFFAVGFKNFCSFYVLFSIISFMLLFFCIGIIFNFFYLF
jgi:hypothetical protein